MQEVRHGDQVRLFFRVPLLQDQDKTRGYAIQLPSVHACWYFFVGSSAISCRL